MIRRNEIWKIYGTKYKEMTMELLAATGLADLIGDRQTRIGIKPNLVTSTPAQFGATTHPEVVAGIIEYLQEHGFDNILIAEGSWVGDRTSEAFEYCGYNALSREYGVPLVDTQKEKTHDLNCGGMKLKVVDVLDRIDFLINVPVFKGHCQTKITCALKNLKGVIPNSEKRRFHTMGLHKPIAHLNAGIRQDFIVVDHICGDLDFEEGGNPVVRNCVMAAVDPVLVDSYVCHMMNYKLSDVPYIRMAEKLGVGSADLEKLQICQLGYGDENEAEGSDKSGGSKTDDANGAGSSETAGGRSGGQTHGKKKVIIKRTSVPKESDLPVRHKILEVAYAVDEVDSCSACYGNLIPALTRLKEEGLLEMLGTKIAIGQGHRGQTGPLGVGQCTSGYDCSISGCPAEEDKIYEELKAYIIANPRVTEPDM